MPATESFEEEKARALAFLDEEPVDADMAAAATDGVDGIPDDAPGLAAEDLAPGDEALVAAACDVLTVGGLPGLDSAMVEDLAAAGITTLGALGAADSLTLTRNLGVTFAQARRMRFLARRAADNLAAQAAEAEMEQGAGESIEATAGPVQASEEAALPIETSEEALDAGAEAGSGHPVAVHRVRAGAAAVLGAPAVPLRGHDRGAAGREGRSRGDRGASAHR